MDDLLDEVFFKALEESNLIEILGAKGKYIMLRLSALCMEKKAGVESQAISEVIFKELEGKNWLSGIMALFFCLDMMLQNNPLLARREEGKEIDMIIKDLEKRMKERGKSNGEGKGN